MALGKTYIEKEMGEKNPYITFLRSYGPIASSDNLYDEQIGNRLAALKVAPPIEIEATHLKLIQKNFGSAAPVSIILTGTAGDGKTYHCRKVFESLRGDPKKWGQNWKISMRLPGSGKELVIIKDLSEVKFEDKKGVFAGLFSAINDGAHETVYLIAANDGHLIGQLEEWIGENEEHREAFKKIESALVKNNSDCGNLLLQLHNLSKKYSSKIFEEILDRIMTHKQWDQCKGCPLYEDEVKADGKTVCPIRINREMLQDAPDGKKNAFRERVGQLLELSKANDQHLPIRHLFMLSVNILLGDPKSPQKLMNCETAKIRSQEIFGASTRKSVAVNPCSNVLGHNLDEQGRNQHAVFACLNSFGIGRETNNKIDNALVKHMYEKREHYESMFANDPYRDWNNYSKQLKDYVVGERKSVKKFLNTLAEHRQKMFFLTEDPDRLKIWDLTVFSSSGKYFDFRRKKTKGESVSAIEQKLVLGLNRTFSGMMVNEDSEVFITSSGGDGRGRLSSIHIATLDCGKSDDRTYINFVIQEDSQIPEIIACTPSDKKLATLQMLLTHFEFLNGIADGGLPANFSRQCYEDFLDFKLRIISGLSKKDRLSFITMQDTGAVETKRIIFNA